MEQQSGQFQKLLFMLTKHIKNDMDHKLAMSKSGLTLLQYAVLRKVFSDETTLNEIAQMLLIKPPTLIPVIDILEKKGLIIRRQDSKDRRKMRLIITKKGQNIFNKIPIQEVSEDLERAFKKIGIKKSTDLVSLMKEVLKELSK